MKIDWKRYAPVGLDAGNEIRWLGAGLLVASLSSILIFSNQYSDALAWLYYRSAGMLHVLKPDAVMTGFYELILGCDVVFSLICLVMPLLAAYHYWYHYQGSKSIYLMRRLPQREELHRRCLSIPAAGLIGSLALQGLLGVIYYLVYILCTPEQCLPV